MERRCHASIYFVELLLCARKSRGNDAAVVRDRVILKRSAEVRAQPVHFSARWVHGIQATLHILIFAFERPCCRAHIKVKPFSIGTPVQPALHRLVMRELPRTSAICADQINFIGFRPSMRLETLPVSNAIWFAEDAISVIARSFFASTCAIFGNGCSSSCFLSCGAGVFWFSAMAAWNGTASRRSPRSCSRQRTTSFHSCFCASSCALVSGCCVENSTLAPSADHAKAWASSFSVYRGNASPPEAEITQTRSVPSLLFLSSGSSSASGRDERNAIYFPSGDHAGCESNPACVSAVSAFVFCRQSHRSSRKRLCCQSGELVHTTTACPSGEIFAERMSVVFRNSSSVMGGLASCASPAAIAPHRQRNIPAVRSIILAPLSNEQTIVVVSIRKKRK